MTNRATKKCLLAAIQIVAVFTVALPATAQPANPPDGFAIGEFWFRPRLEIRIRGEYDHNPVATSGEAPLSRTALGVPMAVDDAWAVHERARLAMAVDRGSISAAIVVQDARVAGFPSPAETIGAAATTSFHAAFVEVHSSDVRPSFVRLGRQEVTWGEGRILGVSDWLLVPRSLDAARARLTLRQLDVEALAVVLAPPGKVPLESAGGAAGTGATDTGTGAQLYGIDAVLHVDPLFSAEAMGLARIARAPLPGSLTPSDTVVVDGRLFGDRAGLSYAAELAYELARIAVVASNRNLAAWAATAHVDWQSGFAWRPKLSLAGSYASGADGAPSGASRRFDPVLPDARAGLGPMGLFAWSNIFDAAATIGWSPLDEMSWLVGYRYVRLADAQGAWFSAALFPVGQNRSNQEGFLGHELDAAVTYTFLPALSIHAGYGALVTGPGARAILSGRSDSGPKLLSVAFAQLSLMAP